MCSKFIKFFAILILAFFSSLVLANTVYPVIVSANTESTVRRLALDAQKESIANKPFGEIMQWVASQMVGKPYVAALLDKKTPEYLLVDTEQTDCFLFAEHVFIMSKLIQQNKLNTKNLADGIAQIRYHGGVSYCTRNHYFKDWILSNQTQIQDISGKLGGITYPYPTNVLSLAIAKSGNIHESSIACIKQREKWLMTQNITYIPIGNLKKNINQLQAGDILGIVRAPYGRADGVHHIGIAYIMNNGSVGMIHASSAQKKVVIEPNLLKYLAKFKDMQGVIVTRAISKAKQLATFRANISVKHDQTNKIKFITQIQLSSQQNINDWSLGFFMLQVLVNPQKPVNLQICELDSKNNTNNCAPLEIFKKPNGFKLADFMTPDLSSGHISLIKPIRNYPLLANKKYQITISGLSNLPQNITAMPQQLFIYNLANKKITYVVVDQYKNQDYDQSAANKLVESQIKYQWQTAKSISPQTVIVPMPVSVNYFTEPAFMIPEQFKIYSSFKLPTSFYGNFTDAIMVNSREKSNVRIIQCNDNITVCGAIRDKNKEGYVISVTQHYISIFAYDPAGVYYAYQSLRQLYFKQPYEIANQLIVDYPRFQYRGIMLDSVRNFISIADIKTFIDVMSVQKLNTLHWHLADDEGWRIGLVKFNKLAQYGSTRSFGNRVNAANLLDGNVDITNYTNSKYPQVDTQYGGFYSESEIRDIIAYANSRQVTVIPEIEMPGHARVLKKAMPELFYDASDHSIYTSVQGYNDNVLPICKYNADPKFTNNINTLIGEINKLFNNQTTVYHINNEISLSGDEVPSTALQNYAPCKIAPWGGLVTNQMSHMFFRLISENLPGYKLSGWQQIVQDDDGSIDLNQSIVPQNVGHIWQWMPTTNQPISGYDLTNILTKNKYPVVLTFADLAYFDIRYAPLWQEPGLYWASDYTNTYTALNMGATTDKLQNITNVVGVEGALWSELLPTKEHLFYMALPKMIGLAEAGWSSRDSLNWRSLAMRLGNGDTGFLDFLSSGYGVRYRGYPNGILLEIPSDAKLN